MKSHGKRQIIVPAGMETLYELYHYAPGIRVGDMLHISGQVGRDENLTVIRDPEAQYTQAFKNVAKVLHAASASFDDVIELETWFAGNMSDLQRFMRIKDRFFTNHYPTWTGFAVNGFSMEGILVEIKCTAWLGSEHEN